MSEADDINRARKVGKKAKLEATVTAALARGEHVHVAEHDGTICRNGTCSTDENGYIAKPKPQISWLDLYGLDPDFTGGMDIDAYLEWSRGEP